MKNIGKWTISFIVFFIIGSLLIGVKSSFDSANLLSLDGNQLHLEINQSYFVANKDRHNAGNFVSFVNQFQPTRFNHATIQFGEVDVWYQMQIRNLKNDPLALVLLLDNPMMDIIDVYQVKNDELHLLESLGDKRPNQTLEKLALPHIFINLDGLENKVLVLKTLSNGTPNMPMSVFAKDDFAKYKTVLYFLWGAFIGIVILMAIYNVILYAGVKDLLYLIYVGYICSFLIVLGVVHGFLAYLVPYAIFNVISDKIIFLFCLVSLCMLAFAVRFLKYNIERNSLLYRATNVMFGVITLTAIYALLVVEYKAAQIFFVVQGLIYILSITLVVRRLQYDFSWAKYYVISWLPLFIGAAVGPLMLTGYIEYNFWTRHALLLGVLFEMTFISMALAERLRTSENRRLYQATHDQFLDIGNISILDDVLKHHFVEGQTSRFSLVTLKINNFHYLTPYLDAENLKKVLLTFVVELQTFFLKRVQLQELDTDSNIKHIVTIKEGVFCFVVLSTDERMLKQLKSDFNQFIPFSYRLPGFNVSFNCICSCVSSTHFESQNEMFNFSFKAIHQLEKSKVPFQIFNKSNDTLESNVGVNAKVGSEDLNISFRPIITGDSGNFLAIRVICELFAEAEQNNKFKGQANLIRDYQTIFKLVCKHIKTMNNSDSKFFIDFFAIGYLSKNIISFLINTLNDTGLRADRFILKVSATGSAISHSETLFVLQELTELGFELAVDEQEFGLANLSWLSELEFRYVTFNLTTIKRFINQSESRLPLVHFVEHLHHLHIKLIVDGVDHHSDLERLKGFDGGLMGNAVGQDLTQEALTDFADEEMIRSLGHLSDLEYEKSVELETLKKHSRQSFRTPGVKYD